jgi:Domain of unknown function (DUF4091)
MKTAYFVIFITLTLIPHLAAADIPLQWLPEHLRPNPFGEIVEADRGAGEKARSGTIELTGARDGYVSCHLLVSAKQYGISIEAANLEPEMFREWFHYLPESKTWYPDALIPVSLPHKSVLPEPDNKIADQRIQAYWLDIWIPKDAKPGLHQGKVLLTTTAGQSVLPLRIRVLPATVPSQDVVTPDHNSYGTSWMPSQYPRSAGDVFPLIHAHHRIFYEHRGVFHQLGYGHGGKVAPEFAPMLKGTGRSRQITSWDLYDKHYGPLLDGSAFANTRRGARPIPFVYLPINPEWPASFEWWGEKGYETEFVNVVRQMEEHFRQKNWTETNFELFFNHKKRYKAFPWDGDETRFPHDNKFFHEYARLMKKATPDNSPVKWVFRTDTSWTMAEQFKELSGVIDFWVVGGGMMSMYDWAPELLKKRGDVLWTYGGTPKVDEPSAAITSQLLKAWLWGASGYVHWLAVSPGEDPWFRFSGGETALVYSGERFGINEPIPSIRLKIQRNCVQDINLLDAAKSRVPLAELKSGATKGFNQTAPEDWWTRNSPLLKRAPQEWNNADIEDALKEHEKATRAPDASAWDRVRTYTLRVAGGERP